MAWFRFTNIEEGPAADSDALLRRYTYLRNDSFFESGLSRYTVFYGKRVYSPAELRQQDRTIWFVRKAKESDPSREILLADAKAIAPYHFPERAIETDSTTFLWLSDLHLSKDHHNFPLKSTVGKSKLAGRELGWRIPVVGVPTPEAAAPA